MMTTENWIILAVPNLIYVVVASFGDSVDSFDVDV